MVTYGNLEIDFHFSILTKLEHRIIHCPRQASPTYISCLSGGDRSIARCNSIGSKLKKLQESKSLERDVIKLSMSLAWRLVFGENVYQAVR